MIHTSETFGESIIWAVKPNLSLLGSGFSCRASLSLREVLAWSCVQQYHLQSTEGMEVQPDFYPKFGATYAHTAATQAVTCKECSRCGGVCLGRSWHESSASLSVLRAELEEGGLSLLFWEIHCINLNSAQFCSLVKERLTASLIFGTGFFIVCLKSHAVLNLCGPWTCVCSGSLFV